MIYDNLKYDCFNQESVKKGAEIYPGAWINLIKHQQTDENQVTLHGYKKIPEKPITLDQEPFNIYLPYPWEVDSIYLQKKGPCQGRDRIIDAHCLAGGFCESF